MNELMLRLAKHFKKERSDFCYQTYTQAYIQVFKSLVIWLLIIFCVAHTILYVLEHKTAMAVAGVEHPWYSYIAVPVGISIVLTFCAWVVFALTYWTYKFLTMSVDKMTTKGKRLPELECLIALTEPGVELIRFDGKRYVVDHSDILSYPATCTIADVYGTREKIQAANWKGLYEKLKNYKRS